MKVLTRALLAVIVCIASTRALPSRLIAQQKQPTPAKGQEIGDDEVVQVKTTLVNVPVTVTDKRGKYVGDLRKEDFRVYEDGIEQPISFFNDAEQRLLIIMLIDTSTSVGSSWHAIGESVSAFVDGLRPDDSVLPIAFDSTPRAPLAHSTKDRALLKATLKDMLSHPSEGAGGTSLFDLIDFIEKQVLPTGRGRKAVVIFSDGADVTSRVATRRSTLRDLTESPALYYSLFFEHADARPGVVTDVSELYKVQKDADMRRAVHDGFTYLQELSDRTGGRLYKVDGQYRDITRNIFTSLAEELKHQYVLGYYPKSATAQPAKRREIKVIVSRPETKAQARRWYVPETPDEK
jgi:Ca-activated chloride channel family protein